MFHEGANTEPIVSSSNLRKQQGHGFVLDDASWTVTAGISPPR